MASAISLAVLLAASSQAWSPHMRLSMEESGARLPVILTAVNARLGTKLTASRSFENEVFTLRVTDRPLAEVLEAIAKPLDAVWHPDGRLEIDRVASERRRAAERKAVESAFKEYQARLAAHAEREGLVTAELLKPSFLVRVDQPEVVRRRDDWRGLITAELLPKVPADVVASQPMGVQAVFQSPNGIGQRPMSSALLSALKRLESVYASVDPYAFDNAPNGRPDPTDFFTRVNAQTLRKEKIAGYRLEIAWSGDSTRPSFLSGRIAFLGADLRRVVEIRLLPPRRLSTSEVRALIKAELDEEVRNSQGIQSSPAADRFIQLLNLTNRSGPASKGPVRAFEREKEPQLSEWLLRPDLHDPYRILAGERAMTALERLDAEGVLLLGRSPVYKGLPQSQTNAMGPRATLKAWTHAIEPSTPGGLWISDKRDPGDRLDRSALSQAVRRAQTEGTVSYENLLSLAKASPPGGTLEVGFDPWNTAYLYLAVGLFEPLVSSSRDSLPALSWIAAWPAGYQRALHNGTKVSVAALPPHTQVQLRGLLQRGHIRMSPTLRHEDFQFGEPHPQLTPSVSDLTEPNWTHEATVSMTRRRSNAIMVRNPAGFNIVGELPTPGQSSMGVLSLSNGTGFTSDEVRGFQGWRLGEVETIVLEFDFAGHFSNRIQLFVPWFDMKAPPASPSQLPSEVRERLGIGVDEFSPTAGGEKFLFEE